MKLLQGKFNVMQSEQGLFLEGTDLHGALNLWYELLDKEHEQSLIEAYTHEIELILIRLREIKSLLYDSSLVINECLNWA